MKTRQILLLIVYSITLIGWLAVWIGERLPVAWLLFVLMALIGGLVSDIYERHVLRPAWNRILLVFGVGLAVADWQWGSQHWFLAIVLLLTYVCAVRALSPKANRDFGQMLALAFLELLAASVLTSSLAYAFIFLAFFILIPWALLLVATKAEFDGEHDFLRGQVATNSRIVLDPLAGKVLNRSLFVAMSIALLITIVTTAAIFIFFPRLHTGAIAGRLGLTKQPTSGLSEQVRLGDFGVILQNSNPALRVVIEAGPEIAPENLYLRAIALNTFDGNSWQNTLTQQDHILPDQRFQWPDANTEAATHQLKVLLEDLGTPLLPVLPMMLQMVLPYRQINIDSLMTIRRKQAQGPSRYTFISNLNAYRVNPKINWQEYRVPQQLSPMMASLTALPSGLPAAIMTQTKQDSLAWLPAALADFASFDYTLELPEGADTLAEFFQRRAGHCELFATALALMLRKQGVPAVVVNGFRGGQWLADPGYYLVRQRNAHSWVELWLPELGWVALDPTPSAPVPNLFWNNLQESWQRAIEGARFFWFDRIVDYDLSEQKDLLTQTREQATTARYKTRIFFNELLQYTQQILSWGVGLFGISLLIWLVTRLAKPKKKVLVKIAKNVPPPRWLRKFLAKLESRYGPRPKAMPVVTWLQALAVPVDGQELKQTFVSQYQQWRFGGNQTSATNARRLTRAWKKQLG